MLLFFCLEFELYCCPTLLLTLLGLRYGIDITSLFLADEGFCSLGKKKGNRVQHCMLFPIPSPIDIKFHTCLWMFWLPLPFQVILFHMVSPVSWFLAEFAGICSSFSLLASEETSSDLLHFFNQLLHLQ